MDLLNLLRRSPLLAQSPLAIAIDVFVFVAFVLVAAAIVADFRSYHRQARDVVRSDRSLVETGSMTAFFLVYYLVVRLDLLTIRPSALAQTLLIGAGLLLVVLGVVFNIWGRLLLGSNWANQIKIYEGHTLVTSGPFAVVRHPLYASLTWIFVGAALIYTNLLALVLTLLVFVPMMYVRGKKEDTLLGECFGMEYQEYHRSTGMLFPRVGGRSWTTR